MSGEVEQKCADLLAAAQAADRQALDRAIRALASEVQRALGWVKLPRDRTVDDLLNEVLLRLALHPPSRKPEKTAACTVFAWIKTTGSRVAADWFRQHRRDKSEADRAVELDEQRVASPDPQPSSPRESVDLDAEFRRVLMEHYPVGLPLYVLMKDTDDALTSAEYGNTLGVTAPNVDTIRKRIRNTLADHVPEARRWRKR